MNLRSSQLRWVTAAFRQLVRLLPATSRNRYAGELADVYTTLLADAARSGDSRQFWLQAIRLFADLGQSLSAEYLDLWRASRINPHVSGILLLFVSSFVWLLIIFATAADAPWAAHVLDASLVATMAIAFGFPLTAFALGRIRLVPYVRESCASQLTCVAGAVVFASWVVLALHLGQTAP